MNSIRFVPTEVHAVFDYVGGVGLIASPFVFGFYGMGGIAVLLPLTLGIGLIAYSLLTDYELGLPGMRVVPMWMHLTVDFVASALLAVAPFLFGYSSQGPNVWLPQVIAGIGVMLLVLVTKTHPQTSVDVSAARAAA